MKIFSKHYHPPGTSPGTLSEITSAVPLTINLIDYTDSQFYEKEITDAAECRPYLERDTSTWIHIRGAAKPDLLIELGQMFDLHLLALEDVVNKGQRAKIEEYDDQIFVVMQLPMTTESGSVHSEQVSLFVSKGFLISFCAAATDPFDLVRERLRKHVGRIRRRGSDYLLYALLDVIIDQAFPLLENYGEQIEILEDELLAQPNHDTLSRLHQMRRDLLLLRRMFWPQREVLNQLFREECPCIEQDTRLYLRDCYDHTIQIIDLMESYREMTASMLDVYLSSISNRLNESMRMLTIIATVFIPLTFIVGVYGMNFGNNTTSWWAMPELRWDYGYPAVWLVMILIGGGMIYLFKRNKWF
jgi:magnesium transporter